MNQRPLVESAETKTEVTDTAIFRTPHFSYIVRIGGSAADAGGCGAMGTRAAVKCAAQCSLAPAEHWNPKEEF